MRGEVYMWGCGDSGRLGLGRPLQNMYVFESFVVSSGLLELVQLCRFVGPGTSRRW